MDDDNGPFVFEPLSSWSVFTKAELKTRPVRVFERVGAFCILGDERDEVAIGILFEVEDGAGLSVEVCVLIYLSELLQLSWGIRSLL